MFSATGIKPDDQDQRRKDGLGGKGDREEDRNRNGLSRTDKGEPYQRKQSSGVCQVRLENGGQVIPVRFFYIRIL